MMDDATALMDPPRTEARHTTDDHSGIRLRRVVLVNEEIKKVVGIAFRVNISALNAILLACKAGSSALGFGVVSHEMRSFSRDLVRLMTGISDRTFDTVATVSAMLKEARLLRVLDRAAEDEAIRPKLEKFIDMRAARMEASMNELKRLTQTIGRHLEDATGVCSFGSAVSRIAKVEATYSSHNRDALEETSSEFDEAIGRIQESLGALKRTMEDLES